jgi:hypothetical protein
LTGGRYDGLTYLWDSGLSPKRWRDKLILVAGGGYADNPIATQTRDLTEQAYFTATIRGYASSDIYYLSAFDTPQTNDKVTTRATSTALVSAIRDWASDAQRLTIMLLDHGTYNQNLPEWFFQVDSTTTPRDTLSSTALGDLLDEVQAGSNPLRNVILYLDMCYAGGFVRLGADAPAGTRRLVLASTSNRRLANFGGSTGALSFTAFFLSSAVRGKTLLDCFQSAREAILALNVPAGAPQLPWLDDDGDGVSTAADGALAQANVLGSLPAFGGLAAPDRGRGPESGIARAAGRDPLVPGRPGRGGQVGRGGGELVGDAIWRRPADHKPAEHSFDLQRGDGSV